MTLAKELHPHSFLKLSPLPDLHLRDAFALWVSTDWGYGSLTLLSQKVLNTTDVHALSLYKLHLALCT